MEKINVIDLDRTLIPFDSFRKYIFLFLLMKNYTIKILFLLFLRSIRVISNTSFKKKIYLMTYLHKDYDLKMKLFAEQLISSIDQNIIEKIKSNSDKQTSNILVTASYKAYAVHIADYVGWDCIASDYKRGNFIHAYGQEKINLISRKYPIGKVKYNYCISDSKSDLKLLYQFKNSELLS